MRTPRTVRRLVALAFPLVALALGGCRVVAPIYDGGAAAPHRYAVLTPDGSDTYAARTTGAGTTVEAPPTNAGVNLRAVFWPDGTASVADGQSCATWTAQLGEVVQQGAALRIRDDGGRVRAITVTGNITFAQRATFNFHTWDTARAGELRQFGQHVVTGLVPGGEVVPLPWRVCARTTGDVVELKAWDADEREPAWGDARWGTKVPIPDGWAAPGAIGWFVGHVSPGGAARFDDLRTWLLETPPPPTPGRPGAGTVEALTTGEPLPPPLGRRPAVAAAIGPLGAAAATPGARGGTAGG
ncbi:MAG TPA: hypothetical protein VHK88_12085 [Aquihabitans sp.]|jgi:hypothetical protein|nr:hypothetical protein [Aquihabitans sp.]